MGMVVIVIPIVAAQHFFPGLGEGLLQGRLFGRVHDHLQQGFIGMGGDGDLVRLRHLRGPLARDIRGHAGRINRLAGLAAHRQDACNLSGGFRGDHLVDERRPLSDAHDLEVSRAAVGVEEVHECLEVRIGGILVPDGVDHHRRAVLAVQQRLDIQFPQQGLRTGLVQLTIRIDEKHGGKVVRAPFCAGRTAILDGTGGAGGQDDLL